MAENSSAVKVTHVNAVPSEFYVQVPQEKLNNDCKQNDIKSPRFPWFTTLVRAVKSGAQSVGLKAKSTVVSLTDKVKSTAKTAIGALSKQTKRVLFSIGVSLSVAAVCALMLLATTSLGYEINVAGETIGVAKSEAEFHQLMNEINKELSYVCMEPFALPEDTDFSLSLIPRGRFTEPKALKEAIKGTSNDMITAHGVYANDRLLFATANEKTAKTVLENYKNEFLEGKENATAEFFETVTVEYRKVPKSALKTETRAAEHLRIGQTTLHTVSFGETLEDVAMTYGVTVADLYKTNRTADLASPTGKQLKIRTGLPIVSVKTTEYKTFTEEIPYEVIEKEDPTHYEGTETVLQAGTPGSREIYAYITSIGGRETERKVLSENVLSVAVTEIIGLGTKEPPSPIGTGSLVMPTNGTLTSRFGSRWGKHHDGLDISAGVGTDIYAADNGTVIYSRFNDGGYGYLIQIDHGNGIVTFYAHCDELLVPEGAVVAKGDVIAKVGNTGRSTGAHLHFEVRKNGTAIDPATYLKEIA